VPELGELVTHLGVTTRTVTDTEPRVPVERSRRGWGSVRKLLSGRWQARYTGPDLVVHHIRATCARFACLRGHVGVQVNGSTVAEASRPLWVVPPPKQELP